MIKIFNESQNLEDFDYFFFLNRHLGFFVLYNIVKENFKFDQVHASECHSVGWGRVKKAIYRYRYFVQYLVIK